MKIVINREELLSALTLCAKAVSSRSPLPAMAMILLKPQKNQLLVTGASSELAIQKTVDAEITGDPVSICLPPEIFGGKGNGIIGSLSDEEVTLDISENKVVITSSVGKTTVRGIPADDFPELPVAKKMLLDIPNELLDNISKLLVPFVATDREAVGKPQYSGIRINHYLGKLWAVAFDGLARCSTWSEQFECEDFEYCVSASMFPKNISDASLWSDKSGMHAVLKSEDTQISSSLLSGTWIPVEEYSATRKELGYATVCTVNAPKLRNAIDLVHVVSDEVSHSIRFVFDNNKLFLSTESQKGSTSIELECVGNDKPLTSFLDGRYVSQILSAIGNRDVEIESVPLEIEKDGVMERVRFNATQFRIVDEPRYTHCIAPRQG